MSDDSKQGKDIAGFLDAQIQMQGTGVIQVKDGHVFVFKRETLQALLDNNTSPKIVVFIKHTPKVS